MSANPHARAPCSRRCGILLLLLIKGGYILMKLLGKVNLLLILIFGCSWGVTRDLCLPVSDAECAR